MSDNLIGLIVGFTLGVVVSGIVFVGGITNKFEKGGVYELWGKYYKITQVELEVSYKEKIIVK